MHLIRTNGLLILIIESLDEWRWAAYNIKIDEKKKITFHQTKL